MADLGMYTAVLQPTKLHAWRTAILTQCPCRHGSASARACRVDRDAMVSVECAQQLCRTADSGMYLLCVSLSSVP